MGRSCCVPGCRSNYDKLKFERKLGVKISGTLLLINSAIAAMCGGTLEGWTSPALPHLQKNNSITISMNIVANVTKIDSNYFYETTVNHPEAEAGITDEEASWVGSLGPLGALFGALPAGFLADKFGRRTILLSLSIPYLMGWIMIILAHKSVLLLYIARFILGLATGVATVAVPLYNEEIAETSIRGELGSYMDIAITVGILYVYAIGAFVPYLWLSIAGGLVPVVFAVAFFWMPESPIYLISKHRTVEAEKSLRWLRNVGRLDTPDINIELREMEVIVRKSSTCCEQCTTTRWDAFKKRMENVSFKSPLFKTVTLVLGLMIFQQISGINAVIFYTVDIFQDAGSNLSPYICTLVIGVVQVVSTYGAALVIDRLGRRLLLLTSGIGMVVSLLILAVFFYLKEHGTHLSEWTWLPLAALNTYIIAFSVGFGPIPWFMMVELATNDTKGWISSLGVSVNWVMVFIMTKMFSTMLSLLGQSETYGILCIFCILGSLFVAIWIPETKGKSREEIQVILLGKK